MITQHRVGSAPDPAREMAEAVDRDGWSKGDDLPF